MKDKHMEAALTILREGLLLINPPVRELIKLSIGVIEAQQRLIEGQEELLENVSRGICGEGSKATDVQQENPLREPQQSQQSSR